jgi:hypothetical protein
MGGAVIRRAAAALLLAGVLAGSWIGQALAGSGSDPDHAHHVTIPVCAEDEPYLRGKGDFDGRRWSRYVCVHIDNI